MWADRCPLTETPYLNSGLRGCMPDLVADLNISSFQFLLIVGKI